MEEGKEKTLALTEKGEAFAEGVLGNSVEVRIDDHEGLLRLLAIIARVDPAPSSEFFPAWTRYCFEVSDCRAEATIRSRLRCRLQNLVARELVVRDSSKYSLSEAGISYLENTFDLHSFGDHPRLWRFRYDQHRDVRGGLLESILGLDSRHVELLVKKLLEAMDYQNVQVTSPVGDKGVDVIGEREIGISRVREVVQVKHHKKNIGRQDVDALRGSLHRFQAIQGTIVATSDFSAGAKKDADNIWTAPITLIGQRRLVELLITHGVGVRKRTIEVLELDLDDLNFESDGDDAEGTC